MNASELRETQLSEHLGPLLAQIDLTLIQKEVVIGAYRLDGIAEDAQGSLVVIAVKTNRAIGTLGQLLLYPHALRKALRDMTPLPKIKARLITTFLDSNVCELANELSAHTDIAVSICIGTAPDSLKLVSPDEATEQVKDQAAVKDSFRTQKIWTHLQRRLA